MREQFGFWATLRSEQQLKVGHFDIIHYPILSIPQRRLSQGRRYIDAVAGGVTGLRARVIEGPRAVRVAAMGEGLRPNVLIKLELDLVRDKDSAGAVAVGRLVPPP